MNKIALVIIVLLFAARVQSQTVTYKVYAVRFSGTAHPFALSVWVDKGPETDSVRINFMVWLIKGSNGKNILVDSGFLNDIPDAADFNIVNYQRPDSALMKLGVKPTDVTDIILSHPHWDHIDGVGLFPNAHIWIQKEDYNYFVGGAWQKGGHSGGFNKRDVRLVLDLNLAGKVTLVNGDNKQIMPGIKVFTGSKHTYNSQYVLVSTATRKIVIASDNIWTYYSLQHMLPPSTGGTLDPAGYVKAMQRMKTLASSPRFILPGHDAQVFSIFPKVTDDVVEIK